MKRIVAASALVVLLGAASIGLAAGTAAVQAFGNFQRMSHTGDTSAKVALHELPTEPGTYAVGALAGLRGEIVMIDGKLLVTRGHSAEGRTEPPAAKDAATLLALAKVSAWQEVAVPSDMKQAEFEAFVVQQASARGIDTATAFAFLVRGEFPQMTWHVVTGGAGGGHGAAHGQGHASNRVFDEGGAKGTLIGFHSGEALEGVISHPGERFHVHYANGDASRSGHVDAYAVRAGSVLLLPARSPYAGEQHREIKALSGKDVQDLLAGRGMGLAKSAELNRYPGPAHVLELSDRLGLSAEQEARTQSVFDAMEARARALGKALVEREAELDRLFASREISRATLESSLAEISKLQGELRRVHLEAHLAQTDILNREQVASYVELRGYGAAGHSGGDAESHRH